MSDHSPVVIASLVFGLYFGIFTDHIQAELRLPSVFADHMVWQREAENPVWGWATPGQEVQISFGEISAKGRADQVGRWEIILPPLEADSHGRDLEVSTGADGKRVFRDVLVGEVWFFCGPSNIYWRVKHCAHAQREIAAADFPEIRFFSVPRKLAEEPLDDCDGVWSVCSPATVGEASGAAYFFSRRLHRELGVPVAVLQSFWGGTRVESWTSAGSVEAKSELNSLTNWWRSAIESWDSDGERESHRAALEKWKKEVASANADAENLPPEPKRGMNPAGSIHRPGRLFNGMVAPLIPYGIRGAVTYPGMGNLYWAEYSEAILHTQIRDWRKHWRRGAFPVGMIQPAPFPTDDWDKQLDDAYSRLREAQQLLLESEPNLGLAPTTDIVNLRNIHFPQKQVVAERLSAWALDDVYDRPHAHGGPRPVSMMIVDGTVRVTFHNTAGGLKTSDGKPPTGFTIAGEDGNQVPARGEIEGDSVWLRAESVSKPVSMRFLWSDTASSNLTGGEGLPVSLFRSDTLELSAPR